MPAPVSIIIPVRNRADLLSQTLASLEAQTTPEWDAVVVDDGSTSENLEHIRRHVSRDPRVRLVERPCDPAGASACRNLGVRLTRGRFLIFLDSDDLLARDALEQRVAELTRRADAGFVVHACEVFRETPGDVGVPWNVLDERDDLDRFLHCDTPWQTAGPIWRREALEEIGPFDEQALCWQDWELHVRALARGLPYAKLERTDHYHRVDSPESVRSRHGDLRYVASLERMFERVRDCLEDTGRLDRERRECLLGLYLRIGQQCAAEHGETEAAFRILDTAARIGLLDRSRLDRARELSELAARGDVVELERRNEKHFPERLLVHSSSNRLRARSAPCTTAPEILRTLRWSERAELREALRRHPVVRIDAPGLTPEELVGLAQGLGKPTPHHRTAFRLPGHPQISLVGNFIGKEGSRAGSAVMRGWHTDSSFLQTPNTFTLLYAVSVPETGGDTWFTDLRRLYRDLDPETRERWKTLHVRHVYRSGDPSLDRGREAVHPLIRRHPDDDRELVFASPGFAERVLELDDVASKTLLEGLDAAVEPPDLVYRWRVGDLLVWDNRAVVHRAMPHDPSKTRCLYRIALSQRRGLLPARKDEEAAGR